MSWLVFSYSLPSKDSSSSRVAIWRRLGRLGTVSMKSGVHILPDRDECAEAFQWLSQEVQQTKGSEALVMRVERFEGLPDEQLVDLFNQARKEDYDELKPQVEELERTIQKKASTQEHAKYLDTLEKLHKRLSDIKRVDFFDSDEGMTMMKRLQQIERSLSPEEIPAASLPSASIQEYQNKRWVTRPKPHVDRLGCIWLIRKFVDPEAEVFYTQTPEPSDITFDMKNAVFGHNGNLCSFETMMYAFQLADDVALKAVSEVIHEIDLRDSKYLRPETEGVAVILKGWLLSGLSDQELETSGITFFEGLYRAFQKDISGDPKQAKKAKGQ